MISEDLKGPLHRIKPKAEDEWLRRAKWAAAGEIQRDTASEHTHLLSSDTAASHSRIIKAYSTPQ